MLFGVILMEIEINEAEFPGFSIDEWRKFVNGYRENPDAFYHAYWYVNGHPIYLQSHDDDWRQLKTGIDFVDKRVVKVDPETERIDTDNDERNTATRIWFETGPVYTARDMEQATLERYRSARPEPGVETDLNPKPIFESTHDTDLDLGAKDYEDGIIKLASKIADKYGHDRREIGTFKDAVATDLSEIEKQLDELSNAD